MRVLDSVVMANRATARAAAPSGHGVVCSAGFTGWLQRVQGAAVLPTVLRQSACSTRSTTLCASMARRTAEHGPHAQAQHVAVPGPSAVRAGLPSRRQPSRKTQPNNNAKAVLRERDTVVFWIPSHPTPRVFQGWTRSVHAKFRKNCQSLVACLDLVRRQEQNELRIFLKRNLL